MQEQMFLDEVELQSRGMRTLCPPRSRKYEQLEPPPCSKIKAAGLTSTTYLD